MMRLIIPVLICCLLSLAACGKTETTATKEAPAAATTPSQAATPQQQQIVSSASVVRVEAPGVEATAGSTAEASVNLTITNGYHVNANPPSESYLIATELTVDPGEGFTVGKPVYPPSVTRKFAFAEKPLAVYEGQTAIKLPLSVASTASKGAHTLSAKLKVQACDDKACYKYSTIETSIPVTVK
ncbi:MAG TPA: protein-disulfide reductase DsbD domain-containing protein [Pyrinomonadaceae bacterium]|jgi:DsbC/DsbD-like thiol-disulfide interchange protein